MYIGAVGNDMTSYWKLIDMENHEVIGVGAEKQLYNLKMMYENKLNTKTKMLKCFGIDNYNKDWKQLKDKCINLLQEADIDSYLSTRIKCNEL